MKRVQMHRNNVLSSEIQFPLERKKRTKQNKTFRLCDRKQLLNTTPTI